MNDESALAEKSDGDTLGHEMEPELPCSLQYGRMASCHKGAHLAQAKIKRPRLAARSALVVGLQEPKN
jgi:hypothetical protein